MASVDIFDLLDRQLVHALQLDGRAPFSTIAAVLGVSDQTVARRYARLCASGKVRVSGVTDPDRLGEVSWFVRIRCTPSATAELARALARRADTSWVRTTSGGTEIVCMVRASSGDTTQLLIDKLPRTAHVTDVSANCVLHVFYGGPDSIVDALTPDQVHALAPPIPLRTARLGLDDVDRQMMTLLHRDGRASLTELATVTGRPVTTLRRRLADLRTTGTIYFDVALDYRALGMSMQTMLWLSVSPDQTTAAGEALATHPEVPFVAATTGSTNLYASVLCPDPAALFTYLSTKIAALPSVQRMETAPVLHTLKTV